MLRFTLLTCLIALATTSQVYAQQPMEDSVKAEIGMMFGLSHSRGPEYYYYDGWGRHSDRRTETRVRLPSALSVWLIPTEMMAIGAEIDFKSYDTNANVLLTGKAAFSPSYTSTPSVYVLGTGSLYYTRTDSYNESNIKGGIGMGLRARIGSALVLRMEGRYERWFEDKI